jgi:hypothetical protein
MSVRDTVGTESYEQMRGLISEISGIEKVNDQAVDGIFESLKYSHPNECGQMASMVKGARAELSGWAGGAEPELEIYKATASHYRSLDQDGVRPMQSKFTAQLPLVRVTLPERLTNSSADTVKTPIGEVRLAIDHALGSLEHIADKFSGPSHLGYRPARVDLITPPRYQWARFAPIAIYLGYRNASDESPSFYMLEGGTAGGEPRVIYFGKTMETEIVHTSWFDPTTLSSPKNTYEGKLQVTGDQLASLKIQSFTPSSNDPYIRIHIHFRRATAKEARISPWLLRAEAVARVAVIGGTMSHTDGPLSVILTQAAKLMDWDIKPTMTVSQPYALEAHPG